jgi:hypothetical protein
MGMRGPGMKKHGAFEHKYVCVARLAESVEQTFQRVPGEDESEVLPGLLGQCQEPLVDGGCEIPEFLRPQTTASMYGRITLSTRQTFAASQS